MDLLMGVFSAFGLSASAGLNAYIPLLVIALLAKFTPLVKLAQPWDALTSWWMIGLLVLLALVEFFADKIPAVNHVNDVIQSFIRPAAGAIVFAASAKVLTDVHPLLSIGAGLLVAGGVHAVKAVVVRPTVTAATAGTGNVVVSTVEDVASSLVSVISVVLPILVGAIIVVVTAWIIIRLYKRAGKNHPAAG
jgi:glucan phosphoethanolaminetransferase (alkaline phosphatase superfamily)